MRLVHFLRGVGETLITIGLVLLLFVAYELWITDIFAHHSQVMLHGQLEKDWTLHPAGGGIEDVAIGDGIAVLRIPRLGNNYDPVIVEGVGTAALQKGPGHYPGTALPGQIGNFVVSGHRTTYGKPFSNLDKVQKGDAVVIETRTDWVTYTVTGREIVSPSDVALVDPVRSHPGEKPTERQLTFTTCNPRFSAAQRLVLEATWTSTLPKAKGLPPALKAALPINSDGRS